MIKRGIESPISDLFGINLIGYFGADTGLGVTARAYAEALRRHGIPFAVVNVADRRDKQHTNDEWNAHYAKSKSEVSHPINLYILHSDFRPILEANPWLLSPGRMQVAMLWWETTALPQTWIPFLSTLDVIAACTPFIANVVANHLPLVPVIQIKHPLVLPSDIRPDRSRFGISDEAIVFTSGFNPNSDPARKNPVAQVVAFRRAFPREIEDVQLLIRVHHAESGDFARRSIQAITQAAAGDPRIQLVTEPLSYHDVLSFYASGDVFVSLHRAEGLGLGIMEAMALGKPVIATGWSGNMGFMDYRTACPVRYRLGPAHGEHSFLKPEFLGPHALWARPLIEDAVAWMRKLHTSPDLRKRIGAAAKARIESYQEEAWGRAWVDEFAALWQTRAFLPALPGKYSSPSIQIGVGNRGKITALRSPDVER